MNKSIKVSESWVNSIQFNLEPNRNFLKYYNKNGYEVR